MDMNLWSGGVRLRRRTEKDMSNTMVSVERTESMGGSKQDAFDLARQGAERDFVINSLTAAHAQYLDQKKVHQIKTSLRIIL